MSSFLNALLPDEEARKTPPLEPWFEGKQDPLIRCTQQSFTCEEGHGLDI